MGCLHVFDVIEKTEIIVPLATWRTLGGPEAADPQWTFVRPDKAALALVRRHQAMLAEGVRAGGI